MRQALHLLKVFACLIPGATFSSAALAQKSRQELKTDTLKDVVVSASRVPERIIQSPVSIEKVTEKSIRESAAPSFFDALENVKGVQMITPSLGFRVINTRGFANPTNVRFVQMVDGVDNQAPHIGGPIGNAIGPNDLDVAGAEIIPGSASALYGMNAINGLANFLTKDPFVSTGLSFQQKTGFNKNSAAGSAQVYNESALRLAHVINSKLAFKINVTYTRGYDYSANNFNDLSPNINASAGLFGNANPAYDAVNSYGNESSNRRTLVLNGKSYVVARTGYLENEVADYHLENVKADGSMQYKFNSATRLSYTYRFALLDNVYQRSNRFRLQDYFLGQQSLHLQNAIFQLKAYQTVENTGKSYNLRSMAENLDRSFKNDDTWFSDFTKGFNQAVADQNSADAASHLARNIADAGRLQPGTTAFNSKLAELQDINNWDIGAALRVKSKMYHTEGQLNVSELLSRKLGNTGLDVLTGFDYRLYSITPDGNYFINPEKGKEDENLLYAKYGGFLQLTKELFNAKLKLGTTLRVDKSEYYSAKFNPRLTAVFSPVQKHSVRASFQTGYRFPSLFEAFSNVSSGGVKRVGGVPVMSNGIFEGSWLRTSVDAFQAAVIKDKNIGNLSTEEAIHKNESLLVKNSYTYLQPEKLRSFELGYRGLAINDKLFMDIDFYYNRYQSFIGQIEVNIPKTTNPDSTASYLNDKKLQDRYRMWTNSKTVVYNYGGSLGFQVSLPASYKVSANAGYARLDKKTGNDGLEDGFNTPKWITNISVSNPKVYKNAGFNLNYKWQSGYFWQSFLVNGNVPAYGVVDAQASYTFPKRMLGLKAGASNILGKNYYSFLGGPQIGSLFYTSLTYGLK